MSKLKINLKRGLGGLLLLIAFCLHSNQSYAQQIETSTIEVQGSKVIVHYKLEDPNPNHLYAVSLYSSKDNFATPLTRVSGDVGTEVKPGPDNKIIWDITHELGDFKGQLTFEVRGRVFIPFVKLVGFDARRIFKRGKNYPLVWTSGNLTGQVNIELFDGQERIWGENNLPNSGKYDWFIPGGVKKGSNYVLKFTNTKDRNDVIVSKTFTIKPKIPLLLKVAALAVVGGGVAILAGGGTKSTTTNIFSPKETSFATWPSLPD